ncbi:MAG: Calx-beta domain-containing protein, partial [Casimicrobiaceae bacterium]
FTFTRTGPTTFPLQVNFSPTGTANRGFDYLDTGFSVVIPAGQSSATLTITPQADALIEGDETVIVTITASPTTYLIGAPNSATVTIADGVPNTVTVVATDPDASETGLDPGLFTFTRTGPTTFPLQVNFSPTGTANRGFDYLDTGFSVTIPAGQSSATLTITPIADGASDPDETVIVTLSPSPTTYLIGAQSSATVTIH